jgi:hypothetical protein
MLNSNLNTTLQPYFGSKPNKSGPPKASLDKNVGITLSKIKNQQQQENQQKVLYQWATSPLAEQVSCENTGLDSGRVQVLKTMTPIDILKTLKTEAQWIHGLGKPFSVLTSMLCVTCFPLFELALGGEIKGLDLFYHPKNRPLQLKKWRYFNASRYVYEHFKMQFISPKTRSFSFVTADYNYWLNPPAAIDSWGAHRVLDLLAAKGLLEEVHRPLPRKKGEVEQNLFLGHTITPLAYRILKAFKTQQKSA